MRVIGIHGELQLELVFEAEDSTFTQPGKVGLWTKADSITYFDDFQFSGK